MICFVGTGCFVKVGVDLILGHGRVANKYLKLIAFAEQSDVLRPFRRFKYMTVTCFLNILLTCLMVGYR